MPPPSDALVVPLKVPVVKSVLAGLMFVGAGALFVWLAMNGTIDLHPLRKLPLSPPQKVGVWWLMSLLSFGMGGLGLLKLVALVRPPELVVGPDVVHVPHGLGLVRVAAVPRSDLQPTVVQDFGGGKVLTMRWSTGKAYLPLAWFPSSAEVTQVRDTLEGAPSPEPVDSGAPRPGSRP